MINIVDQENYIIISIKDTSVRLKKQAVQDRSDQFEVFDAFMSRLNDEEIIKLVSSLKSDRDLISFGISLSGETESDKITEIDTIIRQLSARFIKE
jgi:hypothetical protein